MKAPLATFAVLAASVASGAATLTITPDKQTYLVGETIRLDIFGDPEDDLDASIEGTLEFNGSLAEYLSSSQEPLTNFAGLLEWSTGALTHGDGFAGAFSQIGPDSAPPVDGPLVAEVVLTALAPGSLELTWRESNFRFFSIAPPPEGTTVFIVPEPSTATLVLLGLVFLSRSHRWPSAQC